MRAAHIKTLEALDFRGPVAPLRWPCRLREVGGMANSGYERGVVIEAFETAGLLIA